MFTIRAIWQRTAAERNTERAAQTVTTLKEAASLYRAAAEALEQTATDLEGEFRTAVTLKDFDRGQTGNVAQFVGSKVADAARRAWQASETATEAVVYAAGMESLADDSK
jgi:hypothetical protein